MFCPLLCVVLRIQLFAVTVKLLLFGLVLCSECSRMCYCDTDVLNDGLVRTFVCLLAGDSV